MAEDKGAPIAEAEIPANAEKLTSEEEQAIMESVDDALPEIKKEATTPEPESEEDQITEKTGIQKEVNPEAEDETEGEDPEETPSEKEKSKTSEDSKQTDDDARAKIEKELDKPYGEEDLSDYSPRERALFFEMRRERRKRQDTQEELDLMKFKRLQEQSQPKEDPKAEESDDPFADKDEDDFLTVADVKKILAGQGKPKAQGQKQDETHQVNRHLLMQNWMLEGRMKHNDFLDVVDLADHLLGGDKNAEEEIRQTAARGGNVALTTYNLIKAHPKYEEIASKRRASRQQPNDEREVIEKRAQRIKENENKERTTGGSGSGAAPAGEYTYQELVNMPEEDFMKISPDKRNRLLKKLEGMA